MTIRILEAGIPISEKGVADGVATLDAGGKVPVSQIPSAVGRNTFVVADQVARLLLSAVTGDVTVQTDIGETFILQGTDPSVNGDWIEMLNEVNATEVSAGVFQTGAYSFAGSTITALDALTVDNISIDGNTVTTTSGDLIFDATGGILAKKNITLDGLGATDKDIIFDRADTTTVQGFRWRIAAAERWSFQQAVGSEDLVLNNSSSTADFRITPLGSVIHEGKVNGTVVSIDRGSDGHTGTLWEAQTFAQAVVASVSIAGLGTFTGILTTTLVSTGVATIGDGSATVAINSSDWGIDVTGTITNASMSANQVTAGTFTAGTYDFVGSTITNLGSVTTADINGGTLDGVTIGASVAGAGTFTTLTSTGITAIGDGSSTVAINSSDWDIDATGTITNCTLTADQVIAGTFNAGTFNFVGSTITDLGTVSTADINGGTVDGAVIGGASAVAGTFTTLTSSGPFIWGNGAGQDYHWAAASVAPNQMFIQGQGSGLDARMSLLPASGDETDITGYQFFQKYDSLSSFTNSSGSSWVFQPARTAVEIATSNTGTGTLFPLHIVIGADTNHWGWETDGTTDCQGVQVFDATGQHTGTWAGNAIAIAQGGTGQVTSTAAFDALAPTTTKGDLIVFGATDNVRLAVGTDDQVITADSGEATGVKWATPAAVSGNLVLISSQVASASSSIDFTSTHVTSTYDVYLLVVEGLVTATDNTDIHLLVSNDGGSTFEADASEYMYASIGRRSSGTTLLISSGGATQMQLNLLGVSNVAAEGWGCNIYMKGAARAAAQTMFEGTTSGHDNINRMNTGVWGGSHLTAEVVNGLRVMAAAGNLTSGRVTLYGVKHA